MNITKKTVALTLLAAPLCHATVDKFTFQAIESYLKKPQPHSYVDYQSFEALCKHANGLFTAEQYEEAIAFYKQALALNPTCAQIFFNLGQALYHAKKYSEVLYAYKKTVQHKKDHYRADVQIGKVMMDVKQTTDAIEPFKQSLILDQIILMHDYYFQKHTANVTALTIQLKLSQKDLRLNLVTLI